MCLTEKIKLRIDRSLITVINWCEQATSFISHRYHMSPFRNLGNSFYLPLPLSFGRDAKGRWSLVSGANARRGNISLRGINVQPLLHSQILLKNNVNSFENHPRQYCCQNNSESNSSNDSNDDDTNIQQQQQQQQQDTNKVKIIRVTYLLRFCLQHLL